MTKRKAFLLDSLSSFRTNTYHKTNDNLYTDVRDANNIQNSINIYSWNTGKLRNKLTFPETGENGVGNISNFNVINDSLLVLLGGYHGKVSFYNMKNSSLTIHNIPGAMKNNGTPMGRTSFPVKFINNSLYFEVGPYYNLKGESLGGLIAEYRYDLLSKELIPSFIIPDEVKMTEYHVAKSRFFLNDDTEVMSFKCCNSLFLKVKDTQKTVNLNIPDWIDPKFEELKTGYSTEKANTFYLENYSLEQTLYDEFREYIYLFVGIPTSVRDPKTGRWRNFDEKDVVLYVLEPKDFSILSSINLPASEFYPRNSFVTKEGLFVSKSTFLNKKVREDYMEFMLLEIKNSPF
ncbi:MAG: DUF4221 family protein [Bacteroidota bacterium]